MRRITDLNPHSKEYLERTITRLDTLLDEATAYDLESCEDIKENLNNARAELSKLISQ